MNKTIITGNLGRDPEMRYTPSGQPVTNLSVASNRQYTTNSGERVKETTWFRVSVWGKQAENANKYLRKGSKVLVEGRLTQDPATGGPRIWSGHDGAARASFELAAQNVEYLDSAPANGNGGSGPAMPPADEDEYPFWEVVMAPKGKEVRYCVHCELPFLADEESDDVNCEFCVLGQVSVSYSASKQIVAIKRLPGPSDAQVVPVLVLSAD